MSIFIPNIFNTNLKKRKSQPLFFSYSIQFKIKIYVFLYTKQDRTLSFRFWTKNHDNKFSFSFFSIKKYIINVISSQVLLIFVCILNMKINFHIYDNRKRFTTKYGSMIFNNNNKKTFLHSLIFIFL